MNADEARQRLETAERALLTAMGEGGSLDDVDLERTCARTPDLDAEIRSLYHTWRKLTRTVGDGDDLRKGAESPSTALGGGEVKNGAPVTSEPALEDLLDSLRNRKRQSERYRTKSELGRGGMGFVVRAYDRDVRRHVAMKFLRGSVSTTPDDREERASERSIGRFLEEAQVTGQLDHPGILPVYDVGIDDLGRLYFTMRMVRGETLEAVIAASLAGNSKWTPTGVLSLLLKACEAVAFAHARGVVHRDLKPANVMVGTFGEVYVVDWGLARLVGSESSDALPAEQEPQPGASVQSDRHRRSSSDSSLLTEAGDVLGTPAYMSPEQAAGERDTLDARSDVYSMGAILYHLIAGSKPYGDESMPNDARGFAAVVAKRAPTPLAKLVPDASEELVSICNRAMARERGQRYATVVDLSADLRAYMENRVVAAHRTGVAMWVAKWITRNRRLVVSAAVAAVALFVLLATFNWRLRREIDLREVLQHENDRNDDRLRARELSNLAEDLYPALPETVPAMDAWLKRAEPVLAQRATHDAHARSLSGRDDASAIAQMQSLLRALDELAAHRRAVLARRDDALSIVRRSLEEPAAQWKTACEAIAAHPAYAEPFGEPLRIEPQVGLVPLGPDPRSGLWEFLVVHSGSAPVQDGDRFRVDEASGIVLVLLPGGAGTLTLGSTIGDPHTHVERAVLHPFFIGKHLVTQGQWLRVMGSNPSFCSPEVGRRDRAPTPNEDDVFDLRYPVESVGWTESHRFARRLALRLPFEMQFEFAARAGTSTRFWTGDDPETLAQHENVRFVIGPKDDDFADLYWMSAPVDEFDPNPFGLHDTCGNLQQWCRDVRVQLSTAHWRDGDGACADCSPEVGAEAEYLVRGIGHNETPAERRAGRRATMPEAWRNNVVGLRVSRPLWPCPRCAHGAPAHE